MANLAVAAPTVVFGDSRPLAGFVFPASGTTLATYTGFTVAWVPNLMIVLYIGASGAGNATFVATTGSNVVVPVSNSTTYVFGPLNQGTLISGGLVTVNMSVVTGNSVTAYIQAPATGPKHSPLEQGAGLADY